MKSSDRDKLVEATVKKIKQIFNTKGKDYADSEDVLANFKEEAERLGLTPFQVLMIYKNKHERSINSAVKRNPRRPQRLGEPLDESVIDSIVYNLLLLCMMAEAKKDEAGRLIQIDE